MILSCALNLWILLCGVCTAAGLLAFVFDYPPKRRRAPFRIVLGAVLMLDVAASLCFKADRDVWLMTELLLMVSAMALPYLLFLRRRRMTFFWFGLMICSAIDYLEFVLTSLFASVSYRTELIVFCALWSAAAAAVLLCGKCLRTRLDPDFLESIPPLLYVVIFFAEYSPYLSAALPRNMDGYRAIESGLRVFSASLFVGAVSYMIYRFAKQLRRQREEAARYDMEMRHYEDLMRKNQDVRAFRHDYRNNLFALQTLLQSGRTEEAEQYLGDLSQSLEQTRSRFATGNRLADAILTDKAERAAAQQITFDFDGAIPEQGVPDSILCTVLSNALDNAVEGSASCAPCTVRIRSAVKNAGMVLTIVNPVREKVPIRNGRVQTTKADKQNHGFGTANIRKAAEKCGGTVRIVCTDTEFTIEIGLIFQRGINT